MCIGTALKVFKVLPNKGKVREVWGGFWKKLHIPLAMEGGHVDFITNSKAVHNNNYNIRPTRGMYTLYHTNYDTWMRCIE